LQREIRDVSDVQFIAHARIFAGVQSSSGDV
jgi:hypothetical protein